jgi:hypothetical protein
MNKEETIEKYKKGLLAIYKLEEILNDMQVRNED